MTMGVSGPIMRYLTCPPVHLSEGKTALHLFTALREFFPHLKAAGHCGISIHHYAFDRAVESAMSSLLFPHHLAEIFRLAAASSMSNKATKMLELTNWVLTTGCAAHDCQNAFQWGVFSCEPPKDATDDCYLVVDSERNGYGYLITHVREFLTRHVIFCVSQFREETLLQFWQCLDVPADVAGVLVEHRVMFVDGHLQVSVEFKMIRT